jgi:hypothetical protein
LEGGRPGFLGGFRALLFLFGCGSVFPFITAELLVIQRKVTTVDENFNRCQRDFEERVGVISLNKNALT